MKHQLGIDDSEFIRGEVPMTKAEIRVLTLSKAKIKEDDLILDIGAGTGSLSVEAALLSPQGHVYAVERNAEGCALIVQNAKKFKTENLTVIEGEAPKVMAGLPRLDVVLIGGSGKKITPIIDMAEKLLKANGRMVINCVTVETLSATLQALDNKATFAYHAIQAQITRLDKVGTYHMFKALNPIYIITCVKHETQEA